MSINYFFLLFLSTIKPEGIDVLANVKKRRELKKGGGREKEKKKRQNARFPHGSP